MSKAPAPQASSICPGSRWWLRPPVRARSPALCETANALLKLELYSPDEPGNIIIRSAGILDSPIPKGVV